MRRLLIATACMLAGTALVAQNPPAPASPKIPGAISGVVSDSATRQPVPGVIVTASVMGGRQPGSQITDARGRFVFDTIDSPASVAVTTRRTGYPDGCFGEVSVTQTGGCNGRRIVLSEGQWFPNADIVLSRLGALGGVVSDEHGEPVVGAFVKVLPEVVVGGRRLFASGQSVKTNDLGEYRFAGLRPGRYVVMVPSTQHSLMFNLGETTLESGGTHLMIGNFVTPPAPVGGQARAFPVTYFPGATSLAAATSITVEPGADKTGNDIRLQPVPAANVSGRVEGALPGAQMRLRLVPAGLELLAMEAATASVAPDGSFTFAHVPAGSYTLDANQLTFELIQRPDLFSGTVNLPPRPAQAPGQGVLSILETGGMTGQYASRPVSESTRYYGRVPVTVGATNVTNVIVPLEPGLTISGRYVVEDWPDALRNFRPAIAAHPANGDWSRGIPVSEEAESLSSGPFTIYGVTRGLYDLRAQIPLRYATVKSIIVNGEDYTRRPVDATLGRDITGVVITLTGKLPVVTGVVRDSGGAPAAQASIIAFTTDRSAWANLGLSPAWAKNASTATDGSYQLNSLPAGEFYLAAIDSSRIAEWTDPRLLEQLAPLATRVSLDWGLQKSVELKLLVVK